MPREDVSKVDPPLDQLISNLPRGKVKMITCDTCSPAFSYQDFQVHNDLQFICDICSICFRSEEAVHEHEEEFHPGYYSTNISRKKTTTTTTR